MDFSDNNANVSNPTVPPSALQPALSAAQTAPIAAPTSAQAPVSSTTSQSAQQPNTQPQPQMVSNASPAQFQQPQQQKYPHASRIRDVAEILVGGPQVKTTINEDGSRTVQRIPLDKKSIGMAIALETISGALGGLAAGRGRGPGAAFVGGAQMGQEMVQQRQEAQQRELAQQDKDLARRASVFESNLRMWGSAIQVGRLGREDHEQMVSTFAPTLDAWQEDAPNVIKASKVSEAEAQDIQKHNAADYLRIPDGVVPRIGDDGRQVYIDASGRIVPEGTQGAVPLWSNTYTLVDKNARTPLTNSEGQPMDWVRKAVSYGIPGMPAAFLRAAPGTDLPAGIAGRVQHQVVMMDALQSELNSYARSFGTNKDGSPKFAPVDLKAAIKQDGSLLKAIQQFQRAAGQSTQPDRQIDAMRSDPKTASYTPQIIRLFGPDALEQYKSSREARESAEKKHAEAVATGEYALRQSEVTKNLAEAAAAKDRPGSTGVVSKEDAHAIALAVHDGLQPPDLKGLYRSSGLVKAELAKMGYNQTLAISDWNATQRRLSTMNGPQQVRLQQAVEFAYESLPLLRQKYQEWKQAAGVSGFKAFNKTALEAMKQLPGNAGAAAQALEQQIADLTSEMGTVYKGGNSSTDDSLALAAKNFSADWNEETFNRAYDLAEQNLRIRKNSIALTVKPTGVSETSPYTPNAQQNASADNRQSGTSATTVQPVYAKNPQTGQRVMSIDGGRTWQPAQ